MIMAEPTPTCKILTSSDAATRSKWDCVLKEYNDKRSLYNEQYGTNYNPPIKRWVAADTWEILSAEVLLPEDRTDPMKGEEPNHEAVTDLLSRRGKYKPKENVKIEVHGYHNDACSRFRSL